MSQNKNVHVLLALAITPVHAGVGQQFGAVDLPVQRDTMDYPIIYSSSFKGALKNECVKRLSEIECSNNKPCRAKEDGKCRKLFGSDASPNEGMGSVTVTDLRLLFIPARSAEKGPIYLTTRYMLDSALELLNLTDSSDLKGALELLRSKDSSSVQGSSAQTSEPKVSVMGIADVPLRDISKSALSNLFTDSKLYQSLISSGVAVADNSISGADSSILVNRALIRITRNRLDLLKKTVAKNSLWTEEYIPQGSVFIAVAMENKMKTDEASSQTASGDSFEGVFGRGFYLNLGGKETIGRGLLRVVVR